MSIVNFKPTDDEIREMWRNKYPDTIYCRGKFYRPDESGIFRQINMTTIEQEIDTILVSQKENGIRPKSELVRSIRKLVELKIWKDPNLLDGNPEIFPFINGVINLNTGKFAGHSKDNFISLVQDYEFNPMAKCPSFLSIIQRFDVQTQQFLQEYAGYCLTTLTVHEIALWFYGSPGSGKSTIIEGFQSYLGPYMKYLPPKVFEGDKFGFVHVVGSRLMYATEIPKYGLKDTSLIKTLVSGETMSIEFKGKDPYLINPWAKLIWAMNKIPSVDLLNDGLGRRIQIIEFLPLPETARDPYFKDKVKQEAPGIFNWAYQGLLTLRKRGHFQIPASVKKAKDLIMIHGTSDLQPTDILCQFISDYCQKGNRAKVQAGPFGEAIRSYCREMGYKPLTASQISTGMQSLGYIKVPHHGSNFYKGISLMSKV